jgi:hypothetical protein
MAVGFSNTNKPINPRGLDASPKGYNRAALYSGKALDFDGVNDSIDISNFSLNGYTAFSICFYKTDDFNNAMIFSSADGLSDGINIYQVSPGYFRARLNGSNTDTDLEVSTKDGFFVLTYDGTNLNWYYEAQNIGSGTTSQTFAITNTTSTIARQSYAAAQYLNGQIAGFKIFNTALTAAQVSDLYNNPEKIVPTGVEDTALKLWLPMMEGAGTTAYDGSGNANHGTISGATYVNGVGAPVSQTAVIDWNKGTNLVPDVNNFNSAFEITTTTGLANDPAGRNNAVRFTKTTDTTPRYGFQTCGSATLLGNTNYVISLFYKYDGHAFTSSIEYNNSGHFDLSWVCNLNISASGVTIAGATNCTASVQEYSNGWYRVIVQLTTGASPSGIPQYLVKMQGNTGTSLLVAYAQLEQASSVGPLVPTFGTPQTSPVLLPQGLTSGRDITGVNLFENVRKQGALNLDGNSWAEVHDNASLDITDAITLEAWVYNDGSGFDGFLGRYFTTGNNRGVMIYEINNGTARMIVSKDGINTYNAYATISQGWNHIVGTCNDTEIKIYINGVKGTDGTAPSGSIHVSSYPYEIGRYNANITTQHTNQIAQPRIYNRALTASEVLRNYNSGKSTYQ